MSWQHIRKIQHLLLSGMAVSFGLLVLSPAMAVSKNQVNALIEALRLAAPPNSDNDGMYSQWQVLPGIIPNWTSQCTGTSLTPEQFEANPTVARSVVSCIVQRELAKQPKDEMIAVRNTACWWMTGTIDGCTSGATAEYVQRVMEFYQQQESKDNPYQYHNRHWL